MYPVCLDRSRGRHCRAWPGNLSFSQDFCEEDGPAGQARGWL